MITTACTEDLGRAKRLGDLYSSYYDKLSTKKRSSMKTIELLDVVFDKLTVTVPSAEKVLSCSQPTAELHIKKLVDLGLLQEITGGNYRRRWFAQSVDDAIQGEVG